VASLIGCAVMQNPFLYLGVMVKDSMSQKLAWADTVQKLRFRKKITWVSWDKVLASKKNGGLGVLSFHALNRALLLKWSSIGCSVLREMQVLISKGFDFVFHYKKRVGDDHNTRFWYDSWVFDQPLRVRSVRDGVERQQWDDLNSALGSVTLSAHKDIWICYLNGDGVFRVKEVRTILDDIFLPSVADAMRWVKYIPIKINVFAWRARLDRLLTRSNLNHTMSNYRNMLKRNWLHYEPMQQWATDSLPNYSQRKRISFECKEMLKKRLKEIEAFNASSARGTIKQKEVESTIARRDKRARCYICRKRGHVFWKCQNKKNAPTPRTPVVEHKTREPIVIEDEEVFKYPEDVHVKPDYMVEGTDFSNWNNIWYVSNTYKKHMCPTKSLFKRLMSRFRMEQTQHEKQFIFSHGIGEAVVETNENKIVIPCVLYTPEVTLNVLSLDQLLLQGFVITYGHNIYIISYMFGEEKMVYDGEIDHGKGKGCEVDTREMVAKQNKFLEEYFESIDPKDACPLIKGLEELEWDKNMVHDYLDDVYISVNGTLYAIKVNSFQKFISFLNLIKDDKLMYKNWSVLSKRFEDMLKWFCLIYLGRDVLETLPPIIGRIKIDLLGLYKMVDSMGGYLGVSFGNKWKDVALIHGLTKEYDKELKECYKQTIDMVKCYYETTLRARYKNGCNNERDSNQVTDQRDEGNTSENDDFRKNIPTLLTVFTFLLAPVRPDSHHTALYVPFGYCHIFLLNPFGTARLSSFVVACRAYGHSGLVSSLRHGLGTFSFLLPLETFDVEGSPIHLTILVDGHEMTLRDFLHFPGNRSVTLVADPDSTPLSIGSPGILVVDLSDGDVEMLAADSMMTSNNARILELKRRNMKNTVLTSNTPYPSRKIRRICAGTSPETTKNKDLYAISRRLLYAVSKI
nr:ARID DNA-binding domain-containing protein [Tanacetum cinerariifolium]